MQQHPIPRQITTFEFKLIGQLTIRQAIYLAIGTALAVALYFIIPSILYINILIASLPLLLSVGFAFVPINERPMEIWLTNLVKRLTSPTQYYFRKNNKPPQILLGIQLPPKEVLVEYLRAKQQLSDYELTRGRKNSANVPVGTSSIDRLADIHKALNGSTIQPLATQQGPPRQQPVQQGNISLENAYGHSGPGTPSVGSSTMAFTPIKVRPLTLKIHGTIQNEQNIPIAGVLAYLKKDGHTVRIMKTNQQGYFENSIPVAKDEYILEIDDPHKKYSFARMIVDPERPDVQIIGQRA